jgi:uncharacterized protein with PIN domain
MDRCPHCGREIVTEWNPPSETEVKDYAIAHGYVSSFGRYCYRLWTGNNWRWYGEPIKSTNQWQCLMEAIEWKR